jgi:hypothetical protein
MSPTPTDSALYARVKKLANEKFGEPSSAYKSMWIVREYKKRGGTYSGAKDDDAGLTRWLAEKWVDISRPKKGGGYEPCGRDSCGKGKKPTCRPSKRISSETPKTVGELSAATLAAATRKKAAAPEKNTSFK